MAYESLGLPLPADFIKSNQCYFGNISRLEAEELLKERATCEGTYLVREGDDGYRVSVIEWKVSSCKVTHYKVLMTATKTYYIEPQCTFPSITGLLGYYKSKHTSMVQPLTVPCPKFQPPRNYLCESPTNERSPESLKEISRDAIALKSQITSGKFSNIWKGNTTAYEDGVIVKTECENCISRKYLLDEVYVLNAVRHKHIVRFLGIASGSPLYVVFDDCHNRDLLDYLLRSDTYLVSKSERLRFGQEVAMALHHISRMHYAHRDVRAANVLLTRNLTCKLAGFGHAVRLNQNGEYFPEEGDKPFEPNTIRWRSPEADEYKRFSTASDVWAFGCLLNEIFTDGEAPFSCTLMPNIMQKVKDGYRSKKPNSMPQDLYKLMLKCWHPDTENRLSFSAIQETLKEIRNVSSQNIDLLQFTDRDKETDTFDPSLNKSPITSPKTPEKATKHRGFSFGKLKGRVMVKI